MRRFTGRNYYAVLGVTSSASRDQIKRAYYELVRSAHPDRGGDAETFAVIAEAWEVLGDAGRRRDFDNERRMQMRQNRPTITRLDTRDAPAPPPPEPAPPRRERYSDDGLSEAEKWKRHKRRF